MIFFPFTTLNLLDSFFLLEIGFIYRFIYFELVFDEIVTFLLVEHTDNITIDHYFMGSQFNFGNKDETALSPQQNKKMAIFLIIIVKLAVASNLQVQYMAVY